MTTSDWLTHDDFAPRRGEHFSVAAGAHHSSAPPMELELAEVTEGSEPGGPGPDGEERRQFSLVFLGPAAPALEQGTYQLTHEALGVLELFLVPLGPASGGGGMRYEAAFA